MSASDKMHAAADDIAGKAKEAVGKVTGNEQAEAEGKAEQVEADLRKAGEDVKDAFKH